MASGEIVLCGLDFSDLSKQELALSIEVCEAFQAKLVLHHNLAAAGPGFTRVWEWNEVHRADAESSNAAADRLREILAGVPATVDVEASISSGPTAALVLQLAQSLPASLVILGSHGWSTADHASVTERVLESCPCPVLTVNEETDAVRRFRLRADAGGTIRAAVALDLSAGLRWPLEYAFALARRLPALHLDLLHVRPDERGLEGAGRSRRELESRIPLELAERVDVYVQEGDQIEEIVRFTQERRSSFVLMGEHARSFFRRFFTRDTAREVLHRATCPVWFVPPGAKPLGAP